MSRETVLVIRTKRGLRVHTRGVCVNVCSELVLWGRKLTGVGTFPGRGPEKSLESKGERKDLKK